MAQARAVEARAHRREVMAGDGLVGRYYDALRPGGGGDARAGIGDQAGADDDVVGALAEPDGDDGVGHSGAMPRVARKISSAARQRSTVVSAGASMLSITRSASA